MKTTLVVPAYNEAGRLNLAAFEEALVGYPDLHFVLVDDGSTDDTIRMLRQLADRFPARVALRAEPVNRGKAEAVRQGLLQALESDPVLIGYWDADLATPFAALPGLRAPLMENPAVQVVLGSRVRLLGRDVRRRAVRHYLGRVFATGVSIALKAPVYDTQCGAKLFRAGDHLRAALSTPFRSRWIFDVELLGRLDRRLDGGLTRSACEVPLQQWHDVGKSRVRWSAFVRAPVELAMIYWELR